MLFDFETLLDLPGVLSTKEGQGLQGLRNVHNSIRSEFLSTEKTQDELDAINHYQAECTRLFEIGLSYQLDPAHPECYYGDQIVFSQVAAGATIHRGVYCPSPIYDIIIGGTHRGKILQRPTKRSNITHQYYFDKDGKLHYIKRIYKGNHTGTEFLISKDGRTYGITQYLNGNLVAVCEEYRHEGKLKSYCYVEYMWIFQQACCFRFRLEEYGYDNEGLSVCDVHTFHPSLQLCEHERYQFERKDGYFSSYTVTKLVGGKKVDDYRDGHVFDIKVRRKASN